MPSRISSRLRQPASSRAQCLATDTITESGVQTMPSLRMVNAAAERIYQAWLPHVGEAEALREAEAFASRFHFLIDGPLAPLTISEFDAVLDSAAYAMAAQ